MTADRRKILKDLKRFVKHTQLENGRKVVLKKDIAVKSISLLAVDRLLFLSVIFILMQISKFPKMNTPNTFIYLYLQCVITTEFQQIINRQILSL